MFEIDLSFTLLTFYLSINQQIVFGKVYEVLIDIIV